MHYKSKAEALLNYYKLQVNDTFTSANRCPNCGEFLAGIYDATATLREFNHNWGTCIINLHDRIKALEERYASQ